MLTSNFRPIFVAILLLLVTGCNSSTTQGRTKKTGNEPEISASEGRRAQQKESPWDTLERARLPDLNLPGIKRFNNISTLHLNDSKISYPSGPRLAVLHNGMLTIFKSIDGVLKPEFELLQGSDQPSSWVEMEIFPSHLLPGVILWSSSLSLRSRVVVVCYVNHEFRVVFKGSAATFLDLDDDNIPEIFSLPESEVWTEANKKDKTFLVHTWNGSEFVLATKIHPWSQRFSPEVITAVKDAKLEQ